MSDRPASGCDSGFFGEHSRNWADNSYVYPVISRRCRGLSIGVNLSPSGACSSNCVYCQVARAKLSDDPRVDLSVLRQELDEMLGWASDMSIFDNPRFINLAPELRRVNDIAFSGDGEPTISPVFREAVEIAAEVKRAHGLGDIRIILLTDACHLTRPEVVEALRVLSENNGQIWVKLDAGTEEYHAQVNRSRFTLQHVIENIRSAADILPVCIQSLFMRIKGQGPSEEEISVYVDRLKSLLASGAMIEQVQIYTVARTPAEAFVTPLEKDSLERLATRVRENTGLLVNVFH